MTCLIGRLGIELCSKTYTRIRVIFRRFSLRLPIISKGKIGSSDVAKAKIGRGRYVLTCYKTFEVIVGDRRY